MLSCVLVYQHEKFNSQLLLQTVKPPEAVPVPSRPAVEVKAAAQGGSEGGSDGAAAVGSKPPETSREGAGDDKLTGERVCTPHGPWRVTQVTGLG